MRSLGILLTLCAAAAFFAGCASTPSVRVLPLTTQAYDPKPADAQMPLYAGAPMRPHWVVADIKVDGSADQPAASILALQDAARQVGADALVMVNWMSETDIYTHENYGPRGRPIGTSVTAVRNPVLVAKAVVWKPALPRAHREMTPRLSMRLVSH
jgi:hypothetical protein